MARVTRIEVVRKEDEMLWAAAVVLIIFWILGLVTGYATESFIHGLYAVAVGWLLISINKEVSIYRGLKRMVRSRNYRRANSGISAFEDACTGVNARCSLRQQSPGQWLLE